MELPLIAAILLALLSTLILFLAASYEATFTVLSRSSLERLAENRVSRAALMLYIYEPRHRLRLFTRLGTAAGIAGLALTLSILSSAILNAYHLGGVLNLPLSFLATFIVFLLISVPRRIRFEEEGEEFRIPLVILAFFPLHTMLLPLVNLLDRFITGDYSDEDLRAEKEEELRNLVEAESESGVIEEGEREMIQGVFGFHDRIVREVMVPRVDIEAIELSATLADLLALIKETGHSRLPLYEETLDRIRGIIYAKDLLQLLVGQPDLDLSLSIATFMEQEEIRRNPVPFSHPAHYIPETKKIDVLLHDMRVKKMRLAIVVDEYGGTAGLASTEDLLEEIVGDIQDEYDDEEELYHWMEPNHMLIANARIDIDDLNELLDTDLPSKGFETLGGFIYDYLGSIPEEGQTIRSANLEIKIIKVEGQRISQVQIARLRPNDEAAANDMKDSEIS